MGFVLASTSEAFPATHCTHVSLEVPPVLFENVPVPHRAQVFWPTESPYLPIGHSMQVVAPCPRAVHPPVPVPCLYVPAEHGVHVLLPCKKWFAGHTVTAGLQGPPAAPPHPALQVHADTAVLSAGESENDGHSLHVAAFDSELLYVPRAHGIQV